MVVRGVCSVVSVSVFYSDDQSSNNVDVQNSALFVSQRYYDCVLIECKLAIAIAYKFLFEPSTFCDE